MKKNFPSIIKHPYIYSAIILVIVIIVGSFIFNKNGNGHETMIIERVDFRRQVSVSGKVMAVDSVELGFEQSGKISSIPVTVGNEVKRGAILASLDNSEIRADILQRQANLEREQAKLTSLIQGTRPEQLNIDRQSYTDASRSLIIAIRTAQLSTENALLAYVDSLFNNGNSVNPTLLVRARSENERRSIEYNRLVITEKINTWKTSISSLNENPDSKMISAARDLSDNTLITTKSFIDNLSAITSDLSPANSGLTQTDIDTYRSAVNTAGQAIISAMNNIQTAETTWSRARTTLALSESGATQSDISAQSAMVRASEADLLSAETRLNKTSIRAPFDGVITRIDAKVGEISSPNSSIISMISDSTFKIESYVPEVHIAYIQPDNPAEITLDAYGSTVIFRATVLNIDPAETIRDGVTNYKVTLTFDEDDSRIRSGMTASIAIITLERPDSIVIPRSIIRYSDSQSFVKVLKNKQIIEVPITTGESTSLGQVEVLTGLDIGDQIILNSTE